MKDINLSALINNLPKKISILGREKYFNAAVIIPLVKIKKEYYFLFQIRAKNIRQGGDICFPGGAYEKKDKNFKQTALREIKEELGIKKKNIKIIGRLDTLVTSSSTIVESFIGVIKKKTLKKIIIDKAEVEEILLIPISFFEKEKEKKYTLYSEIKTFKINKNGKKKILFPSKELNLPKQYHNSLGKKEHNIYLYKYKKHVIWGLTSLLINDLIKKYL